MNLFDKELREGMSKKALIARLKRLKGRSGVIGWVDDPEKPVLNTARGFLVYDEKGKVALVINRYPKWEQLRNSQQSHPLVAWYGTLSELTEGAAKTEDANGFESLIRFARLNTKELVGAMMEVIPTPPFKPIHNELVVRRTPAAASD